MKIIPTLSFISNVIFLLIHKKFQISWKKSVFLIRLIKIMEREPFLISLHFYLIVKFSVIFWIVVVACNNFANPLLFVPCESILNVRSWRQSMFEIIFTVIVIVTFIWDWGLGGFFGRVSRKIGTFTQWSKFNKKWQNWKLNFGFEFKNSAIPYPPQTPNFPLKITLSQPPTPKK
jgi:hypothetical protein